MQDLVLALRMQTTKTRCNRPTAAEAWAAELVVKLKSSQKLNMATFVMISCSLLLHMAAAPELADAMTSAKTTGPAYETVRDQDGQLPLLVPMSGSFGRMAVRQATSPASRRRIWCPY